MVAAHLLPNHEGFAGSIDPAFLFFDGVALRDVKSREGFEFALSDSEKHRLVEAAKSPTGQKDIITAAKTAFFLKQPAPEVRAEFIGPPDFFEKLLRDDQTEKQIDLLDQFQTQECHAEGSKTIIQYREWADEWRIRTQVDTTVGTAPPSQAGLRISKMLSTGGARKIADSCEFMAKARGGFKTFVTGTFNEAARERIANGETSIQREATRALDAMTKMYSRGWNKKSGEQVAGQGRSLAYCWVVEVPKNEQGEDNPHIHMLLDWSVEYQHFAEWAKRIESIWGNGYFHLEKIDDPLCAGAYMAKAAGYLTKAAGMSDQGEVHGNRYAISKAARAPSWQTIGTYQLGIMGMLIREVFDSISAKHSEKFIERHHLRAEREKVREAAKKMQAESDKKTYPLWAKNKLTAIGEKLTEVRAQIAALPVRASKYQIVLKGAEPFVRFMNWAIKTGWSWEKRPPSHWYAKMREKFHARKRARGASNNFELAAWVDQRIENFRSALDLGAWCRWEAMGVNVE